MSDKNKKDNQLLNTDEKIKKEAEFIASHLNSAPYPELAKKDYVKEIVDHYTSLTKSEKAPSLAVDFIPGTGRTDRHGGDGVFKTKFDLLPPNFLKKIRTKNFLVAAILRARGNIMSLLGQFRNNRFDVGIEIKIKKEFKDAIKPEHAPKIRARINRLKKILLNCGFTDGLLESEKLTLPEFLDIQTRNALTFGWHVTEIIYDDEGKFHRFRPVDAGTIYYADKKNQNLKTIRETGLDILRTEKASEDEAFLRKKNEELVEPQWVQVINGQKVQVFEDKELIVYNIFPSTDVEHRGYPVTPLDTVINSVITYLSIEAYNKLYFQNGRAAKGMLVIKSDNLDARALKQIRREYQASINSVENAFRTPIIRVDSTGDLQWVPTQLTRRDGEFQYLADQTARNILAAFHISPDEVPGFAHLSRATSQSTLSESNAEYKLTAARDIGLRPLILKFEDFLNRRLFPIIDPELAQLCDIEVAGLDAPSQLEESKRLRQNMEVFYTYDELLDEVEKKPVGKAFGGDIPLNPLFNQNVNKNLLVKQFIYKFLGNPTALCDPLLNYKRDEFWFKWLYEMRNANPEAFKAFIYSPKHNFSKLKWLIKEMLEGDEEDEGL